MDVNEHERLYQTLHLDINKSQEQACIVVQHILCCVFLD